MLVGEGQQWYGGEQRAWEILAELDPDDVCRRTLAAFDKRTSEYRLHLFNQDVFICPAAKRIRGASTLSCFILDDLCHYSRLSILWYLIQARELPPSGNLVNPSSMNSGFIFFTGSHGLPLEKITEKYSGDVDGFIKKGRVLGGEELEYGDASLRLFPFPKIPLYLVLWQMDSEFPARVSLLFDSTVTDHLPMDVIWSTAMMSIMVML